MSHTTHVSLVSCLPARLDERGSLDTPEDETEIARYMRLLGGVTEEPGELQVG